MVDAAAISVLLGVITVAVFWPVLNHNFVNYDDLDYLTANPHVQGGLQWANMVWAFGTGHAGNWHPLTWLSHMADCEVFGLRAGLHHSVSLGFHVLNALLLFGILRRMTGDHWRSAIVAALFAWHPLHVESVAWVAERKDLLSGLFFLLTLGAYARYVEQRKASQSVAAGKTLLPDKRTPRLAFYYFGALGFFALGLMCKPILVTLPFLLLLLDYWPLGRLHLASQPNGGGRLRKLVVEKLPFLLLSLGSSVVTFKVQQAGGNVWTVYPLSDRIANALVSYVRYLGKTFWPVDLAVFYPHPGRWPQVVVLLSAALLGTISLIVLWQLRKRPFLAVGWFWFLGTLVPVIGLVQVGMQALADRYTYLPLTGLFVMLVWGMGEATRFWPAGTRLLRVAAGLALVASAGLTMRQVQFWQNSRTLFAHAIEATSNNYLAYNNLGVYFDNLGQVDLALENYRKSLAIHPQYDDALNNLACVLAGQRQYAAAIESYEAALRVRPNRAEIHTNLGHALSEVGKLDAALEHFRIAANLEPHSAEAQDNLGFALARQGKMTEAIEHFQAAVEANPNYASAYGHLANALASQHRWDEAVTAYRTCLRLNPKDAQACYNLGNVLSEQGKPAEAIVCYQQALAVDPNQPETHCRLALACSRQGNEEEARAHLVEALRLKPDYAQARSLLARLGAPR